MPSFVSVPKMAAGLLDYRNGRPCDVFSKRRVGAARQSEAPPRVRNQVGDSNPPPNLGFLHGYMTSLESLAFFFFYEKLRRRYDRRCGSRVCFLLNKHRGGLIQTVHRAKTSILWFSCIVFFGSACLWSSKKRLLSETMHRHIDVLLPSSTGPCLRRNMEQPSARGR